MASNSRQRSSSSGSDIRVIRGGARGTSGGDAKTRRIPAAGGLPQGGASSVPSSASPSQFESRTIGELRREADRAARQGRMLTGTPESRAQERKQRQVARRKRNKLPFIITGIVAGLAISFVIMYMILANTNIFEIEEVKFEGANHLTAQEAQALVTIPQGTTLLNVDVASIAASLERDAWVKSVDVVKSFPHRLDIIVHEREVGAIVEVTTGQAQTIQDWAIADDGMWLMVVPSRGSQVGSQLAEQIYTDAETALHIVGVPYGLQPEIGTYCSDDNVNNALKIISNMTTELADQLKVVNAAEAESILLTLNNNVQIAFGSPDNIREKERICLRIMEEKPTVVYINVRVPERPTWRFA